MKYVYCLTYNGKIFYIGCAENMRKRYYQHTKINTLTLVGKYIKEIIKKGELPDMRLLDYLPAKEAFKLECTLIQVFIDSGIELLNSQFNMSLALPPHTRVIGKNLKDMLKLIKYREACHKHQYDQRLKIYYSYPDYPLNY